MPFNNQKISVLMPAHEEGRHIYKNIMETAAAVQNFFADFEIVVVDDGSSDNTHRETLRAQASLGPGRVKAVQNTANHGKGFALKTGFNAAAGDFILFLDADLDIHPNQLGKFLEIMTAASADVVIASKRHPESKLNYPLKRKILSNLYFVMTKIIFGLPVRDTQTGLALFKRAVLENVFPKIVVKQYAFSLEILVLAHRAGYKIAEAPVVIDFKRDFSHIAFRDIKNIFMDTLGIFYRLKIIKFYGK